MHLPEREAKAIMRRADAVTDAVMAEAEAEGIPIEPGGAYRLAYVALLADQPGAVSPPPALRGMQPSGYARKQGAVSAEEHACAFSGGKTCPQATAAHARAEAAEQALEVLRSDRDSWRALAGELTQERDAANEARNIAQRETTRVAKERDEALRLLANATDPENAGDWEEAREVGWRYVDARE